MKLSTWARNQGISYRTAWRLYRDGKLPVPSTQLATGTILVDPPKDVQDGTVALYARVSSNDQKADLDRQLARLVRYATERHMAVSASYTEIGSGLNGRRSKLLRLLRDGSVKTIVVEHRDRLARFGCEYIEAALAATGRTVLIIDSNELKDDLVRDVTEVLTSLCARLYGRRSAAHRASRAVAALKEST